MNDTRDIRGPLTVTEPDLLEEIYRFRVREWRAAGVVASHAFPDGRWHDHYDDVAMHVAMWVDGQLAAAIRYTQWPRLADMPDATYFSHAGVGDIGPVGLPERLVVASRYRRMGLYRQIADHIYHHARAQGATHVLMEATEPTSALMAKRGRQILGDAPPDDRFPGVRFQWVLSDLSPPKGG